MAKIPGMSIKEMLPQELHFAAQCTAAEGWVSEDLTTLEGLFLHDPKGCLLAKINGLPAGMCVATSYGQSGFIGELIVLLEFRGQGVGACLLNHGVSLLQERGVESIYLDGVLKAISLYERNGFRKVTRSWRFTGKIPGKRSPQVRPMKNDDMEQVVALDLSSFRADRGFFLRRRAALFPELCHVLVEGDGVIGYIMGRRGAGWISAGPWGVDPAAESPAVLLYAFAHAVSDEYFSLAVLDANQNAVTLVRSLGFIARVDSPWRMAYGRRDDLGISPCCFAVGSAAKG